MKNIPEQSDEEILATAKELRSAYALKRTLRYQTSRNHEVHSESVAEHVFGLVFLAQYFLRVEPSAASLDREKVYSILLFHDFPEIKHGDMTTYYKTKEHEEREREAAKEIFAGLPKSLQFAGELWQEYEEHASPEAQFSYALDKIEPLFELFDPVNERSIKDLQITYDMHVSNKFPVVQNYPVMKRFVEVMSKDMHNRGVFWESQETRAV